MTSAAKKNIYKIVLIMLLLTIIGCIPDDEKVRSDSLENIPSKSLITKEAIPEKPKMPLAKAPVKLSTKDIKDLETALKAGVPIVVKLGSDRCFPCRMMNPIIKELAQEQDGKAVFLSLDVYENRELAEKAGVRVIPTILFYDKNGNPKAKAEGGMSKENLLKAIEKLELNK